MLDLSEVSFVRPQSLVAIAIALEVAVRSGAAVSVVEPRSMDVVNYLSRAHLPEILDQLEVAHNFGPVRERDLGLSIVELTRFNGNDGVVSLADSAYSFALQQGSRPARALHTAVCEAGENVTVHAGIQHGYLVAQYYPQNGTFNFALADSGVGFYERLRGSGATDVAHALNMAGQAGISSTGDSTRGLGLSSIRDHLLRLGGTMTLASRDQQRTYDSTHTDGYRSTNTGLIVGSLVYGSFSAT
ncbi:MAG: hypothetical protein H7288_21695 [Kineosporiaceae bacterium]|nr:hypothetical protein [Aeromicrobium sp.]